MVRELDLDLDRKETNISIRYHHGGITLGFSSIDDVLSAQILENFGKGYESNKE